MLDAAFPDLAMSDIASFGRYLAFSISMARRDQHQQAHRLQMKGLTHFAIIRAQYTLLTAKSPFGSDKTGHQNLERARECASTESRSSIAAYRDLDGRGKTAAKCKDHLLLMVCGFVEK